MAACNVAGSKRRLRELTPYVGFNTAPTDLKCYLCWRGFQMTLSWLMHRNEFSPEDLERLSVALENACGAAAGAHPSPELRALLARKIISIALEGERDPVNLYLRCIREAGVV